MASPELSGIRACDLDPQDVRVGVLAAHGGSECVRRGAPGAGRAGAGKTCGPQMVPTHGSEALPRPTSSASVILLRPYSRWKTAAHPTRQGVPLSARLEQAFGRAPQSEADAATLRRGAELVTCPLLQVELLTADLPVVVSPS